METREGVLTDGAQRARRLREGKPSKREDVEKLRDGEREDIEKKKV